MKKIFSLAVAAMMAVGAWADDANYSPTAEYNVRPQADGTAWKAAVAAAADKANFEITAGACFYAIQQYQVSNIQEATSITLSLTNYDSSNGGSDALAIWAFNGTFSADMLAADFNTAFKNTTGVDAGTAGSHTTTYLLKDVTTVKNPSKFTISGTALTQLKSMADADGTITLLITNKTADLDAANATSKRHYQSSNSANANPPVLTVTIEKPACQIGQQGYSTLADAIAACPTVTAEANEPTTITVNKDVEISTRANIQTQNVKIVGATGAEKILRGSKYTNGLLFLTKDTLATLTLENIIVDGQNLEATAAVFEASNKGLTVLNDVTIQNAVNSSNANGIFCNKSNGFATLNGVTMTNCTATASKALVFVGTSRMTLMGKNNFGAIYVEKKNYITNEDAEGTQTIIVDADREAGVLVKNGDVANYTVTGSALYLSQQDVDVWLGAPTAISTVNADVNAGKTAVKVMKNGKFVISNNGKQYTAAGARLK